VAGYQKLTGFEATTGYIGGLGVPFPVIATILVIIVEIPVSLMFVFCRKSLCVSGVTLIGFTIIATLLAHRDFSQGQNMVMALKNIAIIGGIMAAMTQCGCGKCPMGKGCKDCTHGKSCEKC
jgi:putative oxidoreductase